MAWQKQYEIYQRENTKMPENSGMQKSVAEEEKQWRSYKVEKLW